MGSWFRWLSSLLCPMFFRYCSSYPIILFYWSVEYHKLDNIVNLALRGRKSSKLVILMTWWSCILKEVFSIWVYLNNFKWKVALLIIYIHFWWGFLLIMWMSFVGFKFPFYYVVVFVILLEIMLLNLSMRWRMLLWCN